MIRCSRSLSRTELCTSKIVMRPSDNGLLVMIVTCVLGCGRTALLEEFDGDSSGSTPTDGGTSGSSSDDASSSGVEGDDSGSIGALDSGSSGGSGSEPNEDDASSGGLVLDSGSDD